jgi:hypothetical protein
MSRSYTSSPPCASTGVLRVDCRLQIGSCEGVRLCLSTAAIRPVALAPDESESDRVSKQDQLRLTPNFTTRNLWRSRRWAKGNERTSLFIPVGLGQEFFYMPRNLMIWDLPTLLPIQEEGVLQISITLKNPSPWLGSNPQPLGPVASTTPPR